jgi:AcrR family transcriptional regulator
MAASASGPALADRGTEELRRDAARNRERVLAAARAVIAELGTEFPVDEVARRAGVGVGTIYRRFPTKADLIDAVALPLFERTLALAEEALAHTPSEEGFDLYVRRVARFHAAEGLGVRRLWSAEIGQSVRARIRPILIELLTRAIAGGTLRSDFSYGDAQVLMWSLSTVIDAAKASPSVWKRHLDLLLDGVRPGPPRPLVAVSGRMRWDRVDDGLDARTR